jgi:glycosyltransferase involved in cell wall biosynthesis
MLAYTFYENDNRVRRYAEALAERGDYVDAIVLRHEGQAYNEKFKKVNLYRIQKRAFNEKSQLSYLFKILLFLMKASILLIKKQITRRYDLIHIHSIPDFAVFAAWFPKLMGAKIFLDIHDIVPELYASKFGKDEKSSLFKSLLIVEKLSCSFASYVIIANHLWYEKIIKRSVTKEKCSVYINYPDPNIFIKKKRSRMDHKFILAYPGTLNYHQGLDIAVKAIKRLESTISEIELKIYGDGPEKKNLEILVEKLKLQDKVKFIGLIPMEKIAQDMVNVDIGLVPKRNDGFGNEAFSTKTLEFMMLGIPIIISDTKIDKYYFNSNIVSFFKSGDVQDLSRAIFEIYRNDGERNKQSEKAFAYVQQHSWETMKHHYYKLVDNIC